MNKFGAYSVGQVVKFQNQTVTIIDKIKGSKTRVGNRQGGILTGFKSKPCLYKLDNGLTVRGNKLNKI